MLHSHHEESDPYPAFDVASKLIGVRLGKYKERLRDHRKSEPEQLTAAYSMFQANENEAEGGDEPIVIAEMETNIQTDRTASSKR